MRNTISIILVALCSQFSFAQVSGNVNYQNNYTIPDQLIFTPLNQDENIEISIKVLHNLRAKSYTAIFSLSQSGKTAKEVTQLMDSRIDGIRKGLEKIDNVDFLVDVISMVPMYEYTLEKKIFSKDTYNEIPSGFELKKNLHLKYNSPSQLDSIMRICANYEVYDLVKVNYNIGNINKSKTDIQQIAAKEFEKKKAYYSSILNIDLSTYNTTFNDQFKLKYPSESYQKYQAYTNQSSIIKKIATKEHHKATSQYYDIINPKEFDIVINPEEIEPVIQIMYELKVKYIKKKDEPTPSPKPEKQFYIITDNGDLKALPI